jgi:hypothetical protein
LAVAEGPAGVGLGALAALWAWTTPGPIVALLLVELAIIVVSGAALALGRLRPLTGQTLSVVAGGMIVGR